MKSIVLIALFIAAASASCTNQVCRCRSDAVEVRVPDGSGCTTCYCEARTGAATTVAPTAAPTTRQTAAPAATTRAATTARPTTPAPTTARCGPMPSCDCPAGVTITWATDSRGCPQQCSCGAAPSTVRASTAAATFAPVVTTRQQCPVVSQCACFRNFEVPTFVTDANGCRACECRAAPSTTARAATAAPTTTAAPVCAPLSLRDNCNCAPNSIKVYRNDEWGCLVCGCQAVTTVATTTRATSARTTTAAVRTTVAPTTTARATTRAATTPVANDECPAVRTCNCRPDASLVWLSDDIGCPFCVCQQRGSSFEAVTVPRDDTALPSFVPAVAVVMCAVAVAMVVVVSRKHFAAARTASPLLG